jgi:hypothetical protein
MRWEGGAESSNVEDRRGMNPAMAGGAGIGGLILMAVVYFLTGDARVAQQAGRLANQHGAVEQHSAKPINDRTLHFSETVLKFTEVVWDEQFAKIGKRYEHPKMVLFAQRVKTGCGVAPSDVGPFYCPADRKVYLDPTFFDELEQKLGGSKAEFSQAYVIAHEVGHHVQNLLGYSELVDRHRRDPDANDWSVRLELQADYLAGVWAHHGQAKFQFIEPGDIDAAVKTANAIGDDRIQKRSQGWVSPEKFTHGRSEQRVRSFRNGYETGVFTKEKLDSYFKARSSKDL